MNGNTIKIMKLLSVSKEVALKIQAVMDSSDINYSQCTTREFNAAAREAAREVIGTMLYA